MAEIHFMSGRCERPVVGGQPFRGCSLHYSARRQLRSRPVLPNGTWPAHRRAMAGGTGRPRRGRGCGAGEVVAEEGVRPSRKIWEIGADAADEAGP
jgi:hypothetical protein